MIRGTDYAQAQYDAMEPPEYDRYTEDDVTEAIGHFQWECDGYIATVAGFDGEDMTITIEHYDCNNECTGIVGTVYGVDDLEEWIAAYHAHEAVTPKDENGNTPRFAPAMSNGVIL